MSGMTSEPVDAQADRLFRAARRAERVWPLALTVAILYLMSTCWSFSRPLGGGDGLIATVRAAPSPWVLLGLAGIAVGGRVLSRLAEDAGASPFWWPRQTRRLLVVLAVALPVLLAAVEPTLVILGIDAGSAHPAGLGDWLVRVSVTVGH